MTDQEREELDGLALRAVETLRDYCKITDCKDCAVGRDYDSCPICFPAEDWD